MAVQSIDEIWRGRDADITTSKQGAVRRYTRVWRAVTSDRDDNGAVVAAAVMAVHPIGQVFPDDSGSWLRGLKPSNESFSPYVWLVTGAYSSEYEVKENPLEEPAKISWRTQNFQRPYAKDRDGKAILNSAGDPFDPPVEGDDSRWQCTIRKNVASVPVIVETYKDAMNEASFTVQGRTIPAKCGKIMSIEISDWQKAPNDTIYYIFTWSFAIDPNNWDKDVLDAGLRLKDLTGGRRKIWDRSGQPVSAPVPLDGNGLPLFDPSPDSAVFIAAKLYNLKDFSVLPTS